MSGPTEKHGPSQPDIIGSNLSKSLEKVPLHGQEPRKHYKVEGLACLPFPVNQSDTTQSQSSGDHVCLRVQIGFSLKVCYTAL